MKETIIFKIPIKGDLGGFAHASNFISKINSNQNLNLEETQGITSFHFHGSYDYRSIAERTVTFSSKFKSINKPEGLLGIQDKYELTYCLWLTGESVADVVDLQYDFLIKNFFSQEKIITILTGDKDLYFKASHYLYDVSHLIQNYYDSIYEWDPSSQSGNVLKKLQRKNVGPLKDFMPLQYFSRDQRVLSCKVEDMFTPEEMKKILTGENSLEEYSPAFQGTFQLLREAEHRLKNISMDALLKLLFSGDILAFVLFAFSSSCWAKGKQEDISLIRRWYEKILEFSAGCMQLVENAVHHAAIHGGGISIRYHEADSQYVLKRYGKQGGDAPYLEILITDYAGINVDGNIAKNFISKLGLEDQQRFRELQPIDFLTDTEGDRRGSQIAEAFQNYYANSDHIGKHIGLRIFRRIVERHNGIFGCYSHSDHKVHSGENFKFSDYNSSNTLVQCMPGTGYAVLFPLKLDRKEEIIRSSLGIDAPDSSEGTIKEFLDGYHCEELSLRENLFDFSDQDDKENKIKILSEYMKTDRYEVDGRQRIYYADMGNRSGADAEYFVKALMIAGFDKKIPDFVLYNCSTEYIRVFQQTMVVYLAMQDLERWYSEREFVIALFAGEPFYSLFIIPGNIPRAIWLNKKNAYAGALKDEVSWLLPFVNGHSPMEVKYRDVPPYDILHPLNNGITLFEQYTLQVLETDIQDSAFGCKISNTHMRLGSTIHIDCFVEAELLFSNRFFASRFVYLIVKDLYKTQDFDSLDRLTIYSYALYSESLVEQLVYTLKKIYPKKDIDYAILEREADHRDFAHIDRIRYSTAFQSKEERSRHFRERKVICIVPINSTLKTHEKLLSLFEEDNAGFSLDNIVKNYALVLVGSFGKNDYWEIDKRNKTFYNISLDIKPIPQYFIMTQVKYYEALGCKLCFPDNPLDEVPLVEVNAASTIPNQSFGLHKPIDRRIKIKYETIRKEEDYLSVLKDALIYGHTQRGENHYLYYFKTDEFFLQHRAKIEEWLRTIEKEIAVNESEYHILFCPAHFSNAGFLECINRIIFHEAALVIRVDVDKEYRSNICTKYSNLTEFIQLLSQEGERDPQVIKVHYVDDSIITGRTFFRAKSLISSIVGRYARKDDLVDVHIFEKIFVLLDRNSDQSRLQYIGCWDSKEKREQQLKDSFYAFRTLRISSMRSHGDSCTLCKLEKEARILYRSSSTKFMADYWRASNDKFGRRWLRDKQEEVNMENNPEGGLKKVPQEKAFRRMFSGHMSSIALSDFMHGNYSEITISRLLDLLIEDYENRKLESSQEEAFEYFLSYLKTVSRPFCVFDKAIREAAFDVLLVLAESLLRKDSLDKIIRGTSKETLKSNHIKLKKLIQTVIYTDCTKNQKMDLLLLLMKQLTEMKSNFFIRDVTMQNMVNFAKDYDDEADVVKKMYRQYLYQTKKLLGVSSDTSKSAWFSKALCKYGETLTIPKNILGRLILENTRAYYDGLEKLERNLQWDNSVSHFLCEERWYGTEAVYYEKYKDKILDHFTEPQIREFLQKSLRGGYGEVPSREDNVLENSSETKEKFLDRYNRVKKNVSDIYKQNPLRETCIQLCKELEKAQYRDFCSVLRDLGDLEEGAQASDPYVDRMIPLLAGVQLFRLCGEVSGNKTDRNIEKLCFNITSLIEKILKAKYVQIILECPLECDEWEDLLIGKYNELLTMHLSEEEIKRRQLKPHRKKEYLVIADSGEPDIRQIGIEDASMKVRERLKKCENNPESIITGVYVDSDESYAVWELSNDRPSSQSVNRRLLIYIDFYELNFPQDWHRLRNLMCMNYVINHKVFVEDVKDYLIELMLADKERLIYYMDKANSHTAVTVKSKQFDAVQLKEDGQDSYTRSFVLTLLSDLKVSQVYRQSLKNNYYCSEGIDVRMMACSEVLSTFYQGLPLWVVDQLGEPDRKYVEVFVEFPHCGSVSNTEIPLQKTDKLLLYEDSSGASELFLLLLALVMNAAGPGRGADSIDIAESEKGIRKVTVFLTKTHENCLRISNECVDLQDDIQQLNEELKYPPRMDKGISLWSVSRYVKGIISTLLVQRMKSSAARIKKYPESAAKELEALKETIERVLGEEFEVQVGNAITDDGKKYFYMDIPILASKYERLLVN